MWYGETSRFLIKIPDVPFLERSRVLGVLPVGALPEHSGYMYNFSIPKSSKVAWVRIKEVSVKININNNFNSDHGLAKTFGSTEGILTNHIYLYFSITFQYGVLSLSALRKDFCVHGLAKTSFTRLITITRRLVGETAKKTVQKRS